ncbi:MAG: DUF2231 domain-containing protein [Sphingobium sp.]
MSTSLPAARPLLHPLHALILAFPVAMFPAALLSDITYLRTAEMQWSNFSSWLIVGALIFGGLALLWGAVLALGLRRHAVGRRAALYALLLAGAWITGLVNAFQHSRDAWSSVGTVGLVLSALGTILILAAGWVAHSSTREIAR